MTIYDGWNSVEVPRYDLDATAHTTVTTRLRSGYTVVMPLKHTGSSYLAIRQDGIPTCFALVICVSPFAVGTTPDVEPGDIIIKRPYAGQPIDSPTLGVLCDLDTLAPMERTTRGLQFLKITDIMAIRKKHYE